MGYIQGPFGPYGMEWMNSIREIKPCEYYTKEDILQLKSLMVTIDPPPPPLYNVQKEPVTEVIPLPSRRKFKKVE